MALTSAQLGSISGILGVPFDVLQRHLTGYALDAAVETLIGERLELWETLDFVAIEPKESNYGARIDPNVRKNAIKTELSAWLYLNDLAYAGNSSQTYFERG